MLLQKVIITNKNYLLDKKSIRVSIDGRFDFSKRAVLELQIKHGTKVDFFQDKDNNKSWFLHFNTEGQSQLRIGKDNKCRVISKELRKKLLVPFQLSYSKSVKFEIEDEIILGEEKYYPIKLITA